MNRRGGRSWSDTRPGGEREREREREGERETGLLRGRNVNTRPQTKQSRRDASNLAPRPRRYT